MEWFPERGNLEEMMMIVMISAERKSETFVSEGRDCAIWNVCDGVLCEVVVVVGAE